MSDAIRWLFTFSSPYHLAWFLLSMTVLLASLASAHFFGKRWFHYACIFHALVVVETALTLAFGDGGEVFSVHCIWFNGLMAALHWRLTGVGGEPEGGGQ